MRSGTLLALAALTACPSPASTTEKKAAPRTQADALVRQLGDAAYARREAAERALVGLGEAALPALRQAAASDDAEVRRRAGRVAARVGRYVVAREVAKLQGRWEAVALREDGRTVELNGDRGVTFIFQPDGTVAVREVGRPGAANAANVLTGTWVVRAGSGGQAEMDIDLNGRSDPLLAIYRFEDGRLTLCLINAASKGQKRPTEFSTKRDDGRYLLTMRRDEGAGAAPEPAPPPPVIPASVPPVGRAS